MGQPALGALSNVLSLAIEAEDLTRKPLFMQLFRKINNTNSLYNKTNAKDIV